MFSRRLIPAIMAAAIAVFLTQSHALAQLNLRPAPVPIPAAAATFNPYAHSFGLGSIVVVPSGFGYVQSFMNAGYDAPPTASYDATDYSLHNTTQPPLPPDWNWQPYGVPRRDIHPLIQEWNQPTRR